MSHHITTVGDDKEVVLLGNNHHTKKGQSPMKGQDTQYSSSSNITLAPLDKHSTTAISAIHTGNSNNHKNQVQNSGRTSPDMLSWWLQEDDLSSPDDRLLEHLEPLTAYPDPYGARPGTTVGPSTTADIQLLRLPVVSTEGSVAKGSSCRRASHDAAADAKDGNGSDASHEQNAATRSFYQRQRQQAGATAASNPSAVCLNQASDYLHRHNGSVNGQFMSPEVDHPSHHRIDPLEDEVVDLSGLAVTLTPKKLPAGANNNARGVQPGTITNHVPSGSDPNAWNSQHLDPWGNAGASHGPNPSVQSHRSDPEAVHDAKHFQSMIASLHAFKSKYGHTNVPKVASWFLLGSWVEQIRRRKKVQSLRERGISVARDLPPLSMEETQVLDAMGFKWQAPDFFENSKIIDHIKITEAEESCPKSPRLHSPASDGTVTARVGNDHDCTPITNDAKSPPRDLFRNALFDQDNGIPTPIPYDPQYHNHHLRVPGQTSMDTLVFDKLSFPDMTGNGGSHSTHHWDFQPMGGSQGQDTFSFTESGTGHVNHELAHPWTQQSSFSQQSSIQGYHVQNNGQGRDGMTSNVGAAAAASGYQGTCASFSHHQGNAVCSNELPHACPSTYSVHSCGPQMPLGQYPNPFLAYNPSESCSWSQSVYNYSAANANPFDVYSSRQSVMSNPLTTHVLDNFSGCNSHRRALSPSEVQSSHFSNRSFTAQSLRSHGNQSSENDTATSRSLSNNRFQSQFEAVEALRHQMLEKLNRKSKPCKQRTDRGKKRKAPVSESELERQSSCSNISRYSRASREENSEQIWQLQFSKLKEYYEKNGNCEVPARYDDDAKLGHWVMTQRRQYHLKKNGKLSRLTQARIDQLNTLNFKWSMRKEHAAQWNERYEELIEFKRINGHCLVPQRYSSNPPLGTWVNTQRRHYKLRQDGKKSCLTQERLNKLNEIGFVWSTQSVSVHELDQELDIARFKSFIQGDCDFLLDDV